MKFSCDMPIDFTDEKVEFSSLEAITTMSRAVEAAGLDAIYVTDHPAPSSRWLAGGGHPTLDPFVALTAAAAATTTLQVQTHIVVLPYRNPFVTAKAAASLDHISGGRLILGMGAGYQKIEFDALGSDFKRRGKLFDEALEVMRLAWSGGPVSYKGMDFDAVEVEPRPALSNPPPIWIGGSSPAALERAGKYGDGWSPFFAAKGMIAANRDIAVVDIPDFKERVAKIEEVRAREGRTGPFDLSAGPPVRVGWLGDGDVSAYVDAVGEMAEAGVNWISSMPPHASRAQWIEVVEWYGSEVIAKLR